MTPLIVDMPLPQNCHECEAQCVSALYGRICGMTRKNIMPFLDRPNRPDWCSIKGELVRCGECKHWDVIKNEKGMTRFGVCRLWHDGYLKADFYCADGERKDGERDGE